jgi:hypothetical protein
MDDPRKTVKAIAILAASVIVCMAVLSHTSPNTAAPDTAAPVAPTPAEPVPEEKPQLTMAQQMYTDYQKMTPAEQERTRILYAKSLENKMLDNGMNVDVRAWGPKHTILTLKWALIDKVEVHRMQQDQEVLMEIVAIGFKKFQMTNGFESDLGQTWTWTFGK